MKKIVLALLIITGCLFSVLNGEHQHREEKKEMDVLNTIAFSGGDNYYVEYISVLLNDTDAGSAEDDIKNEILQRYDENSFRSVRFSRTLEELSRLYVNVYQDKKGYEDGTLLFSFEYLDV